MIALSSSLCLPESIIFLNDLITVVDVLKGNTKGNIACSIPNTPAHATIAEFLKAKTPCFQYPCGLVVSFGCCVNGLYLLRIC